MRGLFSGCIAALCCFASSGSARAAHSAAEVHLFFGNPVNSPGVAAYTPGVNPTTSVGHQGGTVVFPVFASAMAGDVGANMAAYDYDVLTDSTLPNDVGTSSASITGVLNGLNSPGTHGDNSIVAQPHASVSAPSRRRIHSHVFEYISELPDLIPAGQTVHVGYFSLTVEPTTDSYWLPLYFAVGAGGFALDATGPITVAFGWNAGQPEATRFQNPNTDVYGTTPGHTSLMQDAWIFVGNPEPATACLALLGMLTLRRRR